MQATGYWWRQTEGSGANLLRGVLGEARSLLNVDCPDRELSHVGATKVIPPTLNAEPLSDFAHASIVVLSCCAREQTRQ